MNIVNKPASLRNYKVSIPANSQETVVVQGKTLRLANSNVPITFKSEDGSLDFTLLSGDEAVFEEALFYRFRVFHADAATQLIELAIGNGGRIGSSKLSGVVSISGGTLLVSAITAPVIVDDRGSSYGASYKSITALAANAPDTIFTPAANVNGAILHDCDLLVYGASNNLSSIIAKNSAPTTVVDGDVLLMTQSFNGGTLYRNSKGFNRPVKIPAGRGLYRISSTAESVTANQVAAYANYTLL